MLPGMSAAFVNIGLERNAFLYVDDARDYAKLAEGNDGRSKNGKRKSRRINDVLREGQQIIVQVSKEPIGTKGARVVTNLTIPGRYLVLMPTVDHIGISRRIQDEKERERLKKLTRTSNRRGMGRCAHFSRRPVSSRVGAGCAIPHQGLGAVARR